MLARVATRLHQLGVKNCMGRASGGEAMQAPCHAHAAVATPVHCPRADIRRTGRDRLAVATYTGVVPASGQAMSKPALSTQATPLRALLLELGRARECSGQDLASLLGLSRTAVWKQVERLRAAGVDIEAVAGRGYRLAARPDLLDAQAIAAALPAALRRRLGMLEVAWQLDSTNSALLRRIDTGLADRSVCLAEQQSAGRGRRGRPWRMPLAGGLALSLYRRFDGALASLAGLSLVAGLAAAETLAACGVAGVGLKWPNDLVARGAKLGGVLVELGGEALGPCHAVIGVGINLRLGTTLAAIGQPAIDLATLGPPPPRSLLAARLIAALERAIDEFAQVGLGPFAARYARLDVLRGQPVQVLHAGGSRPGIARGIDARGALRVAFDEGERAIDSGEVSVRTNR